MDWRRYIEQKPDVMVGKPVFIGRRLTVEAVLELRASGMTDEQLFEAYPQLKPEWL